MSSLRVFQARLETLDFSTTKDPKTDEEHEGRCSHTQAFRSKDAAAFAPFVVVV
jgi:hypothetical protein